MCKALLKIVLVWLIAVCCFGARLMAQKAQIDYSIGGLLSKPAYFPNHAKSTITGFGIDITREKSISPNFSWTLSTGFDYFRGTIMHHNRPGIAKDTAIRHFVGIPAMGGLKLYFGKFFYVAGDAGLLIRVNNTSKTHLCVTPAVGVMLRTGRSKIDLGIKLVNALKGFSQAKNNSLQNGGYGFWSCRAAWVF